MAVYYVFQGETYNEERTGGYVWAPQKNKSGVINVGYTNMTDIHKGDYILHNFNGKFVSISVAKDDCYESNQPHELSEADTSVEWNDEGYRVDTDYCDLEVPVVVKNYKQWLADNYIEGSAFTRIGTGKQQYMCHLADEHAIFLLNKAINLQKDEVVLARLKHIFAEIVSDEESEYNQAEMKSIDKFVENAGSGTIPAWEGKKEAQAMTTSSKIECEIPKRDPKRAANALVHAGFRCEYDNTHRTFLRKKGNPYTEPHHLIPLSKYRDFAYSVDVMENIVSLCSHCHNLLHYGRFEDKVPILEKLYEERKDALRKCGLDLTLEQLKSYYR